MPHQPHDPLMAMYRRKRIGRSQYLAGVAFRRHHEQKAEDALTRCHTELGNDGFALVRVLLIDRRSIREIAQARGMAKEQRYFARRLAESLTCLSEVYGFNH